MYFIGTVKNVKGEGLKGATVDVVSTGSSSMTVEDPHHFDQWQADGDGVYDIQYPDREEPNDRGKILANPDGVFTYRGILPTAYPIVRRSSMFRQQQPSNISHFSRATARPVTY